MYLSYQIDWQGRGYHTPSLYGEPLPKSPDTRAGWPILQAHFAALRNGDFSRIHELVAHASTARWGDLQQYYLYLLSDAAPERVLRMLADDALDSWLIEYPVDVAFALMRAKVLSFVPTILELYARRVEDAPSLPLELSLMLEPEPKLLAERLPEDDDAKIYTAQAAKYHARLAASIGRANAPVFRGEVFGVRRFAALYLEALEDRDNAWLWSTYRRTFEAATGIDMSDCYEARNTKPLTTSAKLEAFLASPDAQRYEHGVRYFWGHRIPE